MTDVPLYRKLYDLIVSILMGNVEATLAWIGSKIDDNAASVGIGQQNIVNNTQAIMDKTDQVIALLQQLVDALPYGGGGSSTLLQNIYKTINTPQGCNCDVVPQNPIVEPTPEPGSCDAVLIPGGEPDSEGERVTVSMPSNTYQWGIGASTGVSENGWNVYVNGELWAHNPLSHGEYHTAPPTGTIEIALWDESNTPTFDRAFGWCWEDSPGTSERPSDYCARARAVVNAFDAIVKGFGLKSGHGQVSRSDILVAFNKALPYVNYTLVPNQIYEDMVSYSAQTDYGIDWDLWPDGLDSTAKGQLLAVIGSGVSPEDTKQKVNLWFTEQWDAPLDAQLMMGYALINTWFNDLYQLPGATWIIPDSDNSDCTPA